MRARVSPRACAACYAVVVRGSEYPKEMLASFLQQQATAGAADGDDAA